MIAPGPCGIIPDSEPDDKDLSAGGADAPFLETKAFLRWF